MDVNLRREGDDGEKGCSPPFNKGHQQQPAWHSSVGESEHPQNTYSNRETSSGSSNAAWEGWIIDDAVS